MAHPVDVYVGKRLRMRRIMRGLSQEALGIGIGVTFQQIQKYERGINRMGSSRLYDFSNILSVPVAYFFEGYEEEPQDVDAPDYQAGMAEEPQSFEKERMVSRETLEMVRNYYAIKDHKVRRRLADLIKSIASDYSSK